MWVAPPTFVDTNVLSAAQLNVISDDLVYLHGLSSTVNIPFMPISIDLRNINTWWSIRNKSQYLNLYIQYNVDAAWVDHLSWVVKYGAWTLASVDPIVYASPSYVTFDLDALGPAVIGTWYDIQINVTMHNADHSQAGYSGGSWFSLKRMFESDTAA